MVEQQVIAATPTPMQLRAELKRMVVADLLGPAGGETEELDERNVRDWYLVGVLAPKRYHGVVTPPPACDAPSRWRWPSPISGQPVKFLDHEGGRNPPESLRAGRGAAGPLSLGQALGCGAQRNRANRAP